MSQTKLQNWQELNQQYLGTQLERLRQILQNYVDSAQNNETQPLTPQPLALENTVTLETLCQAFALTDFERDILLVCAGVELSASFAQLCANAQGNAQFPYPTFSLMLAALPAAHWSAITPASPLRRWRLIEMGTGTSITTNRLTIDERVLHYLCGITYIDERLQGLIIPLAARVELPASQQHLAQQIVELWSEQHATSTLPIIQLIGEEHASKNAIAAWICAKIGLNLHTIRAIDISTNVAEREALARLWEREAMLSNSALLINCQGATKNHLDHVVQPFVENCQSWLLIANQKPLSIFQHPTVKLEVNKLSTAEQIQLWQQGLGEKTSQLNGQLEIIASQFQLNSATIQTICTQIKQTSPHHLWDTCRLQANENNNLEVLAQKIYPHATWDDLVLPEPQRQTLKAITAQVKQRLQVYEKWEFITGSRGLGISALFAGASGTGKTMAAEVLANELRLDLYRIDLSQVVNKYIGETEKNLRQVFDAAETSGAILLFDEADALFGKRSEVKDSHDRYANIEVSYLLQRMEAYRGLAILTTNLKNALDTAFLRRLRFVVQFPFPDINQRREIWRRVFAPKVPTEGLNLSKLAKLNITGGNIRNIALNGAFLAADAGEAVGMKHLLQATHSEYEKLDKPLTDVEIGGWL
ncbi:MAG: ATP-binding protein [Cyanobacteria bacterium P01_D01_bin.116]